MKSEKRQLNFQSFFHNLKELEGQMPSAVALAAEDEKKHLATPRPGFEQFASRIVELAEEQRIKIPRYDLAAMEDELEDVAALAELDEAVAIMSERIRDTLTRKRAAAYKTFCAYYKVLGGIGASVPEVAKALEPVNELFAVTVKAKKTVTNETKTVANDEDEESVTPAPVPAPVKVPA